MKKWQERRANGSPSGGSTVLTAKMFLGKDGNRGYVTADQLFAFNDNAREDDVQEMSAFFGLTKDRHTPIVNRKVRTDKGNNPYKFQTFNRNGNPDGVKVMLIGRMSDFIEDLYDRKFTIDFTYDNLIEEAEQA